MTSHKARRIRLSTDERTAQLQEYNLDLEKNEIYLMGEESYITATGDGSEPGVEYSMANRFLRNFHLCRSVNSGKRLVIHMKTCGGDWHEGMAIHDLLKSWNGEVVIVSYTHARSMSSIILQAAHRRIMMPHSKFMFHYGTYANEGEIKTVYSDILYYNQVANDQMLDIYIDSMQKGPSCSNWSRSKCKQWLKSNMDKKGDVFFQPAEAISYGFADEIFESWDKI